VNDNASRRAVDWLAVRRDYETELDTTVAEIAARHGTATKTIQTHAGRNGWVRRSTREPTSREQLLKRMFHLLEHQLVFLERQADPLGEGDIALFAKLAATLEKLLALAERSGPIALSDNAEELSDRLTERIAQLKRV
jgi:hypothetical protein